MNRADLDAVLADPNRPADEESFDFRPYVDLLLSRWPWVAAVCGVCLGLALADYFMSPRLYRAGALLRIQQRSLVPTAERNPWLEQWASLKYYPTQYRLLESRGLAERVVDDLQLHLEPRFSSSSAGEQPSEEVAAARSAGIAQRLLAGLDVDPDKTTELVELRYTSDDPEWAARIANAFARSFIAWGIEQRTSTVGKASSIISNQIEDLKQQIQDKQLQLQQYSKRTDIVSLDPGSNATLEELARINSDHGAAASDSITKEQTYRELLATPDAILAARQIGSQVPQLEKALLDQQALYESRLQTYKPDWPEMVELQAAIDESRRNLAAITRDEARKVRQAAYNEWQAAQRIATRLDERREEVKADTLDLSLDAVEFHNLQMEIDSKRTLLNDLMSRLSEAGTASLNTGEDVNNVHLIEEALVPGGPFSPSLRRNLGLGLAFGLILGVGGAFALYFLDRSVKTPEELQRLLGYPVLTVVPDLSQVDKGYGYGYGEDRRQTASPGKIELLPERHPRQPASEAYRSLRTALLLSSAEELRTIAVTSADAGEGKTSTAINLAVVMAQLGKRVLLVDADLRKPRIHTLFGFAKSPGLVDSIVGAGQEPEVRSTEVAGLHVLTSGPQSPNPSELLSSRPMEKLLEHTTNRFDLTIIDTPPVSAVTDAILAGSQCDGVLLCFRAHQVHREAVRLCRNQLHLAGVKILGAVFNAHQRGRSYYYRKRYRYYEPYGEESIRQADTAA